MPKVALVVGFGSVGRRHTANLTKLGFQVCVVSQQKGLPFHSFSSLTRALEERRHVDVAVICSPTNEHIEQLKVLYALKIPTLIEKPLSHSAASVGKLAKCTDPNYRVGYLMRYHPVIKEVARLLPACGVIAMASFRFGQYLPLWRPEVDYRQSYSAASERGGGVLLDSSHEIDLILYLLGRPEKVQGVSRKISSLEISSEDYGSARFEMANGGVVDLHLNYIQRIPERVCSIDGEAGSIYANLLSGEITFTSKGETNCQKLVINRSEIFVEELQEFLFSRDSCLLPTIKEGSQVVDLVEAIKGGEEVKLS
jgi:predicted dehydrogenase